MNCTKAMLNVIMDGIRDANMLIRYAKMADEADKADCFAWFKKHAQKRIDGLEADYEQVKEFVGIEEKVKAGDEIAYALHSHILEQMDDLHKKMESM